MGSLSSRPSVPSQPQPQVIYVPAPTPVVTNTGSSTSSGNAGSSSTNSAGSNAAGTETQTTEQNATEIREENLLSRGRGRFGTVKTSFRGLLSLASGAGAGGRKTLLGE